VKYSPQLIAKLQQHFAEKHHTQVSEAEAESYLNAFADLYLLVVGRTEGRLRPQGGATAPVAPLLDK
jgi:hypothetical protein